MLNPLKELNEKIDALHKDQGKIMLYLYNDNETDTKGIIQQVRELKRDVEEIKENERFRTFKIGILSSIFGAVGGFILKLTM